MMALAALQKAFANVLLGGDMSPALRASIRDDGLTADARLQVYRNHLNVSLTEALKATFPVVCRLVDERFFAYLAHEFIRAHPPRDPCLFAYGDALPGFIARFAPCRHLAYLPDVARLEWAMNGVRHAHDGVPLAPAAFAAIAPKDLPRLRLRLQPSVRWIGSPWPIDRIWAANQDAAQPSIVDLASGAARLEVRRHDHDVRLHTLGAADFVFRRALGRGEALETAVTAAMNRDPHFELQVAIADLLSNGSIAAFTLAPESPKETRHVNAAYRRPVRRDPHVSAS